LLFPVSLVIIIIIIIIAIITIIIVIIIICEFLDNTGYVYTPSVCDWNLAFRSLVACSRLSVVKDKQKRGRAKKRGERKRGKVKVRLQAKGEWLFLPFLGLILSRFFLSITFARPQLPRTWNRL